MLTDYPEDLVVEDFVNIINAQDHIKSTIVQFIAELVAEEQRYLIGIEDAALFNALAKNGNSSRIHGLPSGRNWGEYCESARIDSFNYAIEQTISVHRHADFYARGCHVDSKDESHDIPTDLLGQFMNKSSTFARNLQIYVENIAAQIKPRYDELLKERKAADAAKAKSQQEEELELLKTLKAKYES